MTRTPAVARLRIVESELLVWSGLMVVTGLDKSPSGLLVVSVLFEMSTRLSSKEDCNKPLAGLPRNPRDADLALEEDENAANLLESKLADSTVANRAMGIRIAKARILKTVVATGLSRDAVKRKWQGTKERFNARGMVI